MNTCALGSAANDGAWHQRPPLARQRSRVGLLALDPGGQMLDKTLDAPVSTVSRGFRACGRKLCRASARIQSFGLQCFVSDRAAVDVSVPLSVPLALFIVGCD